MEHIFEFTVIAGAILVSMGLAMWMEWYCLKWLMRLMPGAAGAIAVEGASGLSAGESAGDESVVTEEELAEQSAKAA